MPISKTDFVRGLQCEKMLWLDAHAPELKIIPPEVQAKLDAGNEFGDKAMATFGAFTETTIRREDGRLYYSAMLEKTAALLQNGERVICEAAFSWYGNYCAADILKKEENGYTMYEVKNTDTVREEFLSDLGFQCLILKKSGVKLNGCALVLRGDTDSEQIGEIVYHEGFAYKIVDVTKQVKRYERVASERIFELGKLKRKDALMPCVQTGAQCEKPYRCWYYEHCHK